MGKITLYLDKMTWMAKFSDPVVKSHFGTDALPTPFSAATPASRVMTEIQARNPGAEVVVDHNSMQMSAALRK